MAKSSTKDLADNIRKTVADAWLTSEGKALRIRLDLAKLMLQEMKANGWTQGRLAKEIGWKDSFLSNVIHGDQNWTTETYGRIAHALDMNLELRKASHSPNLKVHMEQSDFTRPIVDSSIEDGENEITHNEAATQTTWTAIAQS